ncbi:uncharacterized protein [Bactrocera oleae]|uniref:uncharacterized protein n=1 Tax=Bactrocera oleae TaxID=104688 RepID=UPI0006B7A043|nr:myb-like protein I [Bactrocera oleae]
MIIVLLLLFQSLCLYCQRLVLYIHDRWINPKNSRLLKEAAETSSAATRKLLLEQYHTGCLETNKQPRKRNNLSTCSGEPDGAGGILAEACRFCANSPQGYCCHHFHLQKLEIQKAHKKQIQQSSGYLSIENRPRFWQPLCGGSTSTTLEETWAQRRQQRKVSRELRQNLKNRLTATTSRQHQTLQQQEQQQNSMQKQYQLQRQYLRRQQYEEFMRARNAGNNSSSSSSSSGSPLWDTSTSNSSSGYQSPFASVYNVNGSLSDIDTTDSGLATSIESVAYYGVEEPVSVEELSPSLAVELELATAKTSTITTTYL